MNSFKPYWRLGATSFVLPAAVSENVAFLADKVDDVQLLFFESSRKSKLSHDFDTELLKGLAAEHDLSYTVHLPLDLNLTSPDAARRSESVGEICRIVDQVAGLSPLSYDLHLDYCEEGGKGAWLAAIDSSLSHLSRELGSRMARVAVENIHYPFREVRSLVLSHGMSLCLDFGHALYYGDDIAAMIDDIPRAGHIHYHGVDDKDHKALTSGQRDLTNRIGQRIRSSDWNGVFTLEVYDRIALYNSLLELAEAWGMDSKRWKRETEKWRIK